MEVPVEVLAFYGTLATVVGGVVVAVIRGWFSTTTATADREQGDVQILIDNLQEENARLRDENMWLRRKLGITRERLGSVLAALAKETNDTEVLVAFLEDSALVRPLDQFDEPPEDR